MAAASPKLATGLAVEGNRTDGPAAGLAGYAGPAEPDRPEVGKIGPPEGRGNNPGPVDKPNMVGAPAPIFAGGPPLPS